MDGRWIVLSSKFLVLSSKSKREVEGKRRRMKEKEVRTESGRKKSSIKTAFLFIPISFLFHFRYFLFLVSSLPVLFLVLFSLFPFILSFPLILLPLSICLLLSHLFLLIHSDIYSTFVLLCSRRSVSLSSIFLFILILWKIRKDFATFLSLSFLLSLSLSYSSFIPLFARFAIFVQKKVVWRESLV